MRRVAGIARGRVETNGRPHKDGYDRDVVGSQAELAAAKALNLYWSGIEGVNAPDVGFKVQIRAVTEKTHKLMLQPRDKDDEPFVCVYCRPPRFALMGWIFARDGKLEKYWGEFGAPGRPAFFIPRSDFRPMPELCAWLVESSGAATGHDGDGK